MVTYDRSHRDSEAVLNGVRYKISGLVRSSLVSQYPPPLRTGQPGAADHPFASTHRWSDWRGGIGVDKMGEGDTDRAWFSTCWLRNKGHLLLPPLGTATAAAGAGASGNNMGRLGSELFTTFGANIYSYNDTAWTDEGHNPGSNLDIINVYMGGNNTLVVAGYTDYSYSTNGSTWNQSTKDVTKLTFWDERLWGLDTNGQLWYTLTVGSGEVDDAQLPLPHQGVLGEQNTTLFTGPDATGETIIYAVTLDGLYAHDATNSRFIKTNVIIPPRDSVQATVFNGMIYIAAGISVLEYNPRNGIVRHVGPDQDDGLPTAYGFNTVAITTSGTELFISGKSASGGTRTSILAWDTRGWHVIYDQGATTTLEHLLVSRVFGDTRLWVDHNTSQRLLWFPLTETNAMPKEVSGWTYAASSIHKTPWFDAFQEDVTNTLLEVQISCRNITANETVNVDIAYDYNEGASDANYVDLGTINNATTGIDAQGNGTVVFTIDNNGDSTGEATGYDFESLRIKLTLARGVTNTLSPDVNAITLVYRKKLPPKWGFTFQIDMNESYGGRTPAQQRAALVTAAETTPLVQFTYRDDDGNTRNYWVDVVGVDGLEHTGTDETGLVRVAVREV